MLIRGSSILSTLGATFVNDTRDEPFLPTRGHHLVASFDVVAHAARAATTRTRSSRLQRSQWFPLPWGHVLAARRVRRGIFGTAPLFERFYVGDLSDLLPDRAARPRVRPPPGANFLSTDIVELRYGNYAAKLDAEYRVPIYRGTRSIYGVDFFGSFGVYGLANEQDFTDYPLGYTGFATWPIDLTFNARPAHGHADRGLRLRDLQPRRPDPRPGAAVRGGEAMKRSRSIAVALALTALAPFGARAQQPAQSQQPAHPSALPQRQANYSWDNDLLRASFSYRDVLDAVLMKKLSSGLPMIIAMRAYVYREGEDIPIALTTRLCARRVRPLGRGLPRARQRAGARRA